MAENKDRVNELPKAGERNGIAVYEENPSLSNIPTRVKHKGGKIIQGQKAMLLNPASGEITGEGSVAFIERETVDTEKFVKLFSSGMKGIFKLKRAGQRLVEVLYYQLQQNKDNDRIELTKYVAKKYDPTISDYIFQRGLRELLEKEFIFNSTIKGLYFINVQFMFNGNRIVTAKEYVLKDSQQQKTLDLDVPEE